MKRKLFVLVFLPHLLGAQQGSALHFDGTSDYVALSNTNSVFDITTTHVKTVQLWFRNSASQGAHVRIFSTGSANWTSGFWFGFQSGSSNLMVEASDGSGWGVTCTATTATRGDNLWHHATAVFDNNILRLYLDGVLESTVSIAGEGAMLSSGAVHIGNSYDNESLSYFMGSIDELRVWDRVLCEDEILATIDCELTGNELGLASYYQFNEGTAGGDNSTVITMPDLTSAANTGTLNSFALTGTVSNWISPGGVSSGTGCDKSFGSVSATISADTICTGMTVSLSASGLQTYTWQPGNLTGSVQQTSPMSTTIYTVSGFDGFGCLSVSTLTALVINCTGLSESGTARPRFYPNPCTDQLWVTGLPDGRNIGYSIINALGQQISVGQIGVHQPIDVSIYQEGIYFLQTESGCYRITVRRE